MEMGTRRLFVTCAAGLIAAGVLAGCAAGAPQVVPTGGATVSASSQPSEPSDQPMPLPSPVGTPSASPLPSGLRLPGPTKPPPSGEQTLTGQVEAGVERGCLILHDSTGLYQLLGGDPTVVYAGATVSVTGHVVTGVMSYCMQGRPFQITEAHRI
jgi:hypothetical protein